MIRLPQNRFCIEDRASDLTQNPYLTFSLLSAAATKGITEKMDPPEATNKSLYDITEEEGRNIKNFTKKLIGSNRCI